MTFICYPKCTTCQKAKKWLDENQIAYNFRDIKLENPTYDELSAWYQRSGLPLKKFFNTSGLLYKSMKLRDKLPKMSEDEMLSLLATDGMLVKRPLLVGDDFVLVGFKETEWAEHLKKQIKEALKQRTSDRPCQFFIKVCGAIDKEYSSLYLLRPKHLDRQILSFKFSYHLLPSCLLFSCEFWALLTHSSYPAKAQLFPPARCRPARL